MYKARAYLPYTVEAVRTSSLPLLMTNSAEFPRANALRGFKYKWITDVASPEQSEQKGSGIMGTTLEWTCITIVEWACITIQLTSATA